MIFREHFDEMRMYFVNATPRESSRGRRRIGSSLGSQASRLRSTSARPRRRRAAILPVRDVTDSAHLQSACRRGPGKWPAYPAWANASSTLSQSKCQARKCNSCNSRRVHRRCAEHQIALRASGLSAIPVNANVAAVFSFAAAMAASTFGDWPLVLMPATTSPGFANAELGGRRFARSRSRCRWQ